MKKIFLFTLAALTFSSCVKDVDPTNYEQTKEKVLTENFNTTFGVTEAQYANHRWGMNTMPLIVTKTMKAANTNENQWEDQGYVLPADITEAELEKVKKVFGEKGAEKYESLIDLDCFFVQQVYKGDSVYVNHAGGEVIGSEHMDWL